MKGEPAHNLKPTKSPRRRPNKRVRDALLERISHEYDSTRQKMPADHPRFALFCYFSTVAASMVSWVYGDPVRYPFPDAYQSERLYKLAQWLGQVEDKPIEERKELRRARIADLCRVFPDFLERCTYDDDVSGVLLWTWDGIEAVWREEEETEDNDDVYYLPRFKCKESEDFSLFTLSIVMLNKSLRKKLLNIKEDTK